VELTLAEYEEVRSDPTHFLILPGHELPEAEVVLKRNGRFGVVEKEVRGVNTRPKRPRETPAPGRLLG
jgi:hypothetical protein